MSNMSNMNIIQDALENMGFTKRGNRYVVCENSVSHWHESTLLFAAPASDVQTADLVYAMDMVLFYDYELTRPVYKDDIVRLFHNGVEIMNDGQLFDAMMICKPTQLTIHSSYDQENMCMALAIKMNDYTGDSGTAYFHGHDKPVEE